MAKKYGIDISRYQGQPDFSKVKNDVDFVIVQAGYGKYSSQKDVTFDRNYAECKKYNIPVGVYWYSYARTVSDARLEAQACLEVIKGKKFEYPIYIDLEEDLASLGRATVSSIAIAFCQALEKAGYYAGVYISRSPAQSYLATDVTSKYALWLAEYGSRLNYTGSVGMWQNSSAGKIAGISGNVDTDICYVDYPAAVKAAGLNGYEKPKPTKTLDTTGMKKGDHGRDVLAYKQLLIIAKAKGIVKTSVNNDTGFGDGATKATNELLKYLGYKENGIAGENLLKKLGGLLK